MSIAPVLSRLSGVRRVGPAAYFAVCPCHAEKTGSLSVRLAPGDGLLQCRCFGCGAGTGRVLEALGLSQELSTVYIAPPLDDAAAARRQVLGEIHRRGWMAGDTPLLMAGADLHRALLDRIDVLHRAADRMGPDPDAVWLLVERAAALDAERRLLEWGLDHVVR